MLTPLKDADHVPRVFFLGAAAPAKGLRPQDLVLPHRLGPAERHVVVGARPAAAAAGRVRGGGDVEAAGQAQAAALLGLHRLLQRRAPGDALGAVVGLGRVDGHVHLVHARPRLHAQLGDARHPDLRRVLRRLVDVLQHHQVPVLGQRRLDEDGVAGHDGVVGVVVVAAAAGGGCPATRVRGRHCGTTAGSTGGIVIGRDCERSVVQKCNFTVGILFCADTRARRRLCLEPPVVERPIQRFG